MNLKNMSVSSCTKLSVHKVPLNLKDMSVSSCTKLYVHKVPMNLKDISCPLHKTHTQGIFWWKKCVIFSWLALETPNVTFAWNSFKHCGQLDERTAQTMHCKLSYSPSTLITLSCLNWAKCLKDSSVSRGEPRNDTVWTLGHFSVMIYKANRYTHMHTWLCSHFVIFICWHFTYFFCFCFWVSS